VVWRYDRALVEKTVQVPADGEPEVKLQVPSVPQD